MSLAAGTRLGPYEIVSAIGAGGMGEVYRARDTKLNREVAIKVLLPDVAGDPDRLARFKREAEVLASLNHPHLAAIYGFEDSGSTHALVLELVDGPTLADRIAQGPIPVAEALSIAKQIADALEAAHERGIIHRDLKPANIKVRDDGTVKILDFGLAKAIDPMGASSASATMSPTLSIHATQVGIILGTAAYMAPEQARGKAIDKRADIWAFGVVLYEMIAGSLPFPGEDISHVLARVIERDPDWTALPPATPPALVRLIARCLKKDPRARLRDIGEARLQIEELLATPEGAASAPPSVAPPPARARAWLMPAAMSATLTAVAVGAAAWALRPAPAPPIVARFSFLLPADQNYPTNFRTNIAVSPDGSQVAYVGGGRVFLRSIGDLTPHAIPGTEGGAFGTTSPMFSPDGQSIAFFAPGGTGGDRELKRVPVNGGSPVLIAKSTDPDGSSWGPDGIVFADRRGIVRVSAGGGTPERIVTAVDGERLFGPRMLPDGKTVIFTRASRGDRPPGNVGTAPPDEGQIVAQSVTGGSRRVLVERGSDGRYLPIGYLTYAVGGTTFGLRFDPKTLSTTGEPQQLIVGVRRGQGHPTPGAQFDVSSAGTLVYVPGSATASGMLDLVLSADSDAPARLGVVPAAYAQPRVSPDGRVVAVGRVEGEARRQGPRADESSDIWTFDLSGTTEMRRLTFGGNSRFPVWTADGRRLTFQSARDDGAAIFWQSADGTGTPERLTTPAEGEAHVPDAWSRDGTRLLFSIVKGSTRSLWVFTLRDRKIARFGDVESPNPLSASFSPDGRWVAYAAAARQGGLLSRDGGVFVEPFPPTGEKHQVPKTAIDFHPVWAPDGRSILYTPSGTSPPVSVPVTTGSSIAFGAPKPVPHAPRAGLFTGAPRGYDVLPDGRILSVSAESSDDASANEIRIVLNWFTELQQRVPTR